MRAPFIQAIRTTNAQPLRPFTLLASASRPHNAQNQRSLPSETRKLSCHRRWRAVTTRLSARCALIRIPYRLRIEPSELIYVASGVLPFAAAFKLSTTGLIDGNTAHMMSRYETAADTSSRERPHRSSRTPIWNGNDEFTTQRDHELQEACDAAYLIASFTPERKALMKILCECTYQPHQEVVELFGQRNASGALFGATGVICKCERIVRNVLYDQFMSLDSGLAVCCLLGTWQKNAGLLQLNYECIFYLT